MHRLGIKLLYSKTTDNIYRKEKLKNLSNSEIFISDDSVKEAAEAWVESFFESMLREIFLVPYQEEISKKLLDQFYIKNKKRSL